MHQPATEQSEVTRTEVTPCRGVRHALSSQAGGAAHQLLAAPLQRCDLVSVGIVFQHEKPCRRPSHVATCVGSAALAGLAAAASYRRAAGSPSRLNRSSCSGDSMLSIWAQVKASPSLTGRQSLSTGRQGACLNVERQGWLRTGAAGANEAALDEHHELHELEHEHELHVIAQHVARATMCAPSALGRPRTCRAFTSIAPRPTHQPNPPSGIPEGAVCAFGG